MILLKKTLIYSLMDFFTKSFCISLSFIISINIVCGQIDILIDNRSNPINDDTKLKPCISENEYLLVHQKLNTSKARLTKSGKLKKSTQNSIPSLNWPLREGAGFNDYNEYYVITNYVDLDPSAGLQDYNCGAITYNGHLGTDISLVPFKWIMKNENHVEVIAAASGVISYKQDGNFDDQCSLCTTNCPGNAIVITHSDGSSAYYWHLKNGSTTSKNVGDAVTIGEYLGVVASSGFTDGPHLHFEIRDVNNLVIDPFSGSCNSNSSLWQSQIPYRDAQFIDVSTHSSSPNLSSCQPQQSNYRNYFYPNEKVYLFQAMKNFPDLTQRTITIYDSNNNVYSTWNQTSSTINSSGSFTRFYWWNTLTLNANVSPGKWRFEVSFLGKSESHEFIVLPAGTSRTFNDECSGAKYLLANQLNCSPVVYNNLNSTPSAVNPDFICGQEGLTRDVWFYTNVPSSGNLAVSTSQVNGGLTDMVMTAYRGTCGSLEIVDCDNDSGIGLHSSISMTGLIPGETIFLRVIPNYGESLGEFSICASDHNGCPPDYSLNGVQNSNHDYETNGHLVSNQTISNNANVVYDSALEVNLMPNFEVKIGVVFNVYIDGCGNIY